MINFSIRKTYDHNHGVNVPKDLNGSLLVYKPSDYLTLFARNYVCFVISAYPLTPSPHASLIVSKQL